MAAGDTGHDEPYWGTVMDIGEEAGLTGPIRDKWDDALREAAENSPEGWYTLETFVYVKRRNPGWVDGFKVHLKAGEPG